MRKNLSPTRCLLGRRIHFKIALGSYPECIRNPVKEREHRRDVYRLGNLRFRPPMVAKLLHIFGSGAVGRLGHLGHILKQRTIGRTEPCFVQFTVGKRLYCSFFGSLNTQEVGMRVQSIRTAVEPRYPTRDGLLGLAGQVSFGEMDGIAELHDLLQKVGPMTEAFQNAWHFLAP